MKKTLLLLAVTIACGSAYANDPNIEQEGNKTTVKREACLLNGGSVTDEDYRYFICSGGKYDGIITNGPVAEKASCALEISAAKDLLQADGTPKDESDTEMYLYYSNTSLAICKGLAQEGKWNSLVSMLDSGKKVCKEAQQGNSDIYLASCNLKVADVAAQALGQ